MYSPKSLPFRVPISSSEIITPASIPLYLYVCVYVCMCMYVCMRYISVRKNELAALVSQVSCVRVYMYASMHTQCIYAWTHVCVCVCVCVCAGMCSDHFLDSNIDCSCVCTSIHMHVCTYICYAHSRDTHKHMRQAAAHTFSTCCFQLQKADADYIYIHTYVYAHVCMYIYIYIYRHTWMYIIPGTLARGTAPRTASACCSEAEKAAAVCGFVSQAAARPLLCLRAISLYQSAAVKN
jgi:hypothetical protein